MDADSYIMHQEDVTESFNLQRKMMVMIQEELDDKASFGEKVANVGVDIGDLYHIIW
jgi:hypothetical protein